MHTILVTGASGALGRIVCRDLLNGRRSRLIAASRTPAKLSALAEAGAELRRADFDDPSTLDTAFAGADRALIVSTDELTTPGRRRHQHAAALAAAKRSRVRHVVYTSMPNPATSSAIPFAPEHAAMEADLRDSGIDHTSLRISWYQENLLAYLPAILRDGVWYSAAGAGRISYIARADAADVAAQVLTSDHGFGEVDVGGPDALTVDEIADLVSAVLGRPLKVEHVGQERLKAELARQGVPAAVIAMVAVTEANQAVGQFDVSSDTVDALAGRRPTRLCDFLRDHAGLLLGHAPAHTSA